MLTIIDAFLATCILWQLSGSLADPPGLDARSLYQQAAEAIGAGDTAAAIEPLEQLTRDHRDSELAIAAAPHLAECYLIAGRPIDALDLLTRAMELESDDRLHALILLACKALPPTPDAAGRIRSYVDTLYEPEANDDEPSGLATDATDSTQPVQSPAPSVFGSKEMEYRRALNRELAGRYEKLRDYASAIACQRREATVDGSNEVEFRLPLAWAHHELTRKNYPQAIAILSDADKAKLSAPQRAAVLFELAEALASNNQTAEALQQLERLSELVEIEYQAATPAPAWTHSVQLRRAELLVNSRRYSQAVALMDQVQPAASTFVSVHEFDFLRARCAIANIEFENALTHLQSVVNAQNAAAPAIARATWMQGEVYFLQRNYALALDKYERVVAMRDCEQWQARGLLQAGKCYELLQQPLKARSAYERLQSEYRSDRSPASDATGKHDPATAVDASVFIEAAERIAALKPSRVETGSR